MNMKAFLIGATLAIGTLPAAASAASVFSEDFSGATPGTYGPGAISGTKFSLNSSNIDIVGVRNGSFYSCGALNPGGNCLDLVGDQGPGGTITSTPFALNAGTAYTLAFDFGGAVTNTFSFAVDGFTQTLATIDGVVSHESFTFTPLTSNGAASLSFTDLTSRNSSNGASLANISITSAAVAAVPEPASWAMIIVGFGMIGGGLRYRQRRTTIRYI